MNCLEGIPAGKNNKFNANIDSVILGYMRVKNKDSRDGYTLIPVWDFQGDYGKGNSILTINAMNGNIIDRSVGY